MFRARPRRDKPKIMFFLTEDWYFLSHRLRLARACRDLGWDVVVATRVQTHGEKFRNEGFRLLPLRLRRRARAHWAELPATFELIKILLSKRPDILHQVGLKPVINGSLAAMLAPPTVVVNALTGMGYIFTSGRIPVRVARILIQIMLRYCLRPRNHWLIVQNDDDASSLVGSGLILSDRLTVIRGSGVDPDEFIPTAEPELAAGEPVIAVVVSRMLKDKGMREVVFAARALKLRKTPVHIHLVGAPDPDNPSSIPEKTLRQWDREGCIEWIGHKDNISKIWSGAYIAVLPSYREGLPRGRPIVTTDVPGCNDVVEDGVTGFTVPPQDWVGLADAVEKLASSATLRVKMGVKMRDKVVAQFSEAFVVRQTINLYLAALDADKFRREGSDP